MEKRVLVWLSLPVGLQSVGAEADSFADSLNPTGLLQPALIQVEAPNLVTT